MFSQFKDLLTSKCLWNSSDVVNVCCNSQEWCKNIFSVEVALAQNGRCICQNHEGQHEKTAWEGKWRQQERWWTGGCVAQHPIFLLRVNLNCSLLSQATLITATDDYVNPQMEAERETNSHVFPPLLEIPNHWLWREVFCKRGKKLFLLTLYYRFLNWRTTWSKFSNDSAKSLSAWSAMHVLWPFSNFWVSKQLYECYIALACPRLISYSCCIETIVYEFTHKKSFKLLMLLEKEQVFPYFDFQIYVGGKSNNCSHFISTISLSLLSIFFNFNCYSFPPGKLLFFSYTSCVASKKSASLVKPEWTKQSERTNWGWKCLRLKKEETKQREN